MLKKAAFAFFILSAVMPSLLRAEAGTAPSRDSAPPRLLIESYFSMDMGLGWKPDKNWEVAVAGQNLIDAHHPEFGTSSAVRSPVVEIQRSVYAKATLFWGGT